MLLNGIGFQNNFNRISFNNAICPAFNPKMLSFKGDTFERSNIAQSSATSAILGNIWDVNKTKCVCNRVFDDVIKSNPLYEELNIALPNVYITEYCEDALADYNFIANNICFNPDIKGDYYMCIASNTKTGQEVNIGIYSKRAIRKDLGHLREKGYELELLKLNNQEKEAYISALIAHELRHCLQSHLMASTKSSMDTQFNILDRRHKRLLSLAQEGKRRGILEDERNIPELNQERGREYYRTYKPKDIVEDDVKLKFSSRENDARYLSTKEHLLYDLINHTNNAEDEKHYTASPAEMDANNCALEYLLKLKAQPNYSSMRQNVFESITKEFFINVNRGAKTMESYGYPPLIQK